MSRKIVAMFTMGLVAMAWGTQAQAARYAVENTGNYTYKWDFNNATPGFYPDVDGNNSWTRTGNAAGLADPNFDYWDNLGNPLGIAFGSKVLKVTPDTSKNQAYQFRLDAPVDQFVYSADISWSNTTTRLRNIGLKWRYDELDNGDYGPNGQSSLDGEDVSGGSDNSTSGSKLKFLDTGAQNYDISVNAAFNGTLFTHDFGANYVGEVIPGSNNDVRNNAQFTVQVEYNLNNSGVIDLYYRSKEWRAVNSGGNPAVPWANNQTDATAGNPSTRGAGGWILMRSIPITSLALINEFALGGNDFNVAQAGTGGAGFDNVHIWVPVPEPTTVMLLGLALPAGAALVWRRRRAA